MKKIKLSQKMLVAALTGLLIALSVSGCSDDKKEAAEKTKASKEAVNPFDHSHEPPVTDVQKHKFEHEIAAQCAQKELANATNKEAASEKANKSCTCIAEMMMKTLTPQEAEKFLQEKESPLSLKMKFDSAAYHCLQEKAPEPYSGFTHPYPVTQ